MKTVEPQRKIVYVDTNVYHKKKKNKSFTMNTVILFISIFILLTSIVNIYLYYSDVYKIQQLKKEELRLKIEILNKELA